jgi:hypothetical protein
MVGMVAKWLVVTFMVVGSLSAITVVGKPRQPLRPGTAAVIVFVQALQIVAIILYWH